MLWRGRRQSDNIDDQRGGGGLGGGLGGGPGRIRIGPGIGTAGGGGLSGILILVVLFFVLRACGIDPMAVLTGDETGMQTEDQGGSGPQSGSNAGASDEMKQFVATVLAETEDTWNGIFKAQGKTYEEPRLTLFSGQIRSACGFASAASGPFYCPEDHKVYLDTNFFTLLDRQFGASGDFAQAYVIAHEVGHHVQNLIGILPKFNQMRQRMDEVQANQMSVRVELQADCFAGIWGHFTDQKGILEKGDVEEALNAAQQIGDDTLQRRTQGYVVPESFNHGTSAQRQAWFARGFKSGRLQDCDTFNNPI
jgi:predicted metalloprotease